MGNKTSLEGNEIDFTIDDLLRVQKLGHRMGLNIKGYSKSFTDDDPEFMKKSFAILAAKTFQSGRNFHLVKSMIKREQPDLYEALDRWGNAKIADEEANKELQKFYDDLFGTYPEEQEPEKKEQ